MWTATRQLLRTPFCATIQQVGRCSWLRKSRCSLRGALSGVGQFRNRNIGGGSRFFEPIGDRRTVMPSIAMTVSITGYL